MTAPMSATERKRKSRAAAKDAGAMVLSIQLSADATRDLAQLVLHLRRHEAGITARTAVEQALRHAAASIGTSVRPTAMLLRKQPA